MAISIVIVGAGQRGRHVYGTWLADNKDRARAVAVVDGNDDRRDGFARAHDIPTERRFRTTNELWDRGRIADACIIATPDRDHHAHATAALEHGYHVLLEKPMATSLEQVRELAATAAVSTGTLSVAHVLRYAPLFRALHGAVQPDVIGDVVSVSHRENVWAFHMAHSFVRGNWARRADSTPMIVAKTCHDFDLLVWNLISPVTRLSSFGSLMHFLPENAPDGATERCTDGCPAVDCPFDARRVYLDPAVTRWPIEAVTDDLTERGRLEALQTGPYGRCVYQAGSDVVDHQVVTMELADGATVTLTVQGHSDVEERTMRYDGTRGTVRARTGNGGAITVTDHRGGSPRFVEFDPSDQGHLGGDAAMMDEFVDALERRVAVATGAAGAVQSHVLAFLAEKSRLTGEVIEVPMEVTM